MYSTNETKLFKSSGVVIIFEIQIKWAEIRPNSDHFLANGQNSGRLREIRPERQKCLSTIFSIPRSIYPISVNLSPIFQSVSAQSFPNSLLDTISCTIKELLRKKSVICEKITIKVIFFVK